ncbi:hypothetical protein BH09MYX1_BH09MYX1_35420 [soil metagenome]
MASDPRLQALRGVSRRSFLRWSTALGVALGLERAAVLNVISDTAGTALADKAACASTLRSLHFIGGNGGHAWFQLLFPHHDIAKNGGPNIPFHARGKTTTAAGTDRPLVYAPESPFQKRGPTRQITAFMAGTAENHTNAPTAAATIAQGTSMIASIAAIQSANPSLIPVVAVNPFQYGTAVGAPQVNVVNKSGLADLFDSTASKTLLQTPDAADLHDSYYRAFQNLNAASGRRTLKNPNDAGKLASSLLGRSLGDRLRVTPADEARYGIQGAPTNVADIARILISSAKAFGLGLTSSVILPAMSDDPHQAFANVGNIAQTQANVARLGKILDCFMSDCDSIQDPSGCGRPLSDSLMMTFHGDTPKNPLVANAWPDNTPGNSNWVYVYGCGYLKTGWFGGISASGAISGFNPATGADVPNQSSAATTNAAAAAAAYAAARGDMRRVQDFYRGGPIDGIVRALQM